MGSLLQAATIRCCLGWLCPHEVPPCSSIWGSRIAWKHKRYVSDNVGPAQTHYGLLLSELQGTRTRVLKGRGAD